MARKAIRKVRRPLKYGDILFCGRNETVAEVVSSVKGGENVSVVGERKIGKTSLLSQVAGRLRKEGHRVAELDCNRVNPKVTRILLRRLLFLILDTAPGDSDKRQLAEVGESELFEIFEKRLDEICGNLESHTRLVLILDEVEELVKFEGFLAFLKALSSRFDQLVLVFASYDTLAHLGKKESPNFFTIFSEVRLGGLESEEEVVQLFETRARMDLSHQDDTTTGSPELSGVRASLGRGVLSELRRVTGFNPFYIQEMFSSLLEKLKREARTVVSQDDCSTAEETLLRDQFIKNHIKGLWNWCGKDVGIILSALADSKLARRDREGIEERLRQAKIVAKDVGDSIDRAVQVGLIVRDGNQFCFSSGILESWVRENKQLSV